MHLTQGQLCVTLHSLTSLTFPILYGVRYPLDQHLGTWYHMGIKLANLSAFIFGNFALVTYSPDKDKSNVGSPVHLGLLYTQGCNEVKVFQTSFILMPAYFYQDCVILLFFLWQGDLVQVAMQVPLSSRRVYTRIESAQWAVFRMCCLNKLVTITPPDIYL